MTFRYTLLAVLLLPLMGAKAQSIAYPPTIPVEIHRLVMDHAQGGNVSDWIDSLRYTPLEIKDKKDIFHTFFRMDIIGNSIGILSFQNQSSPKLLIYATDGSLIKVVDYTKASGLPKGEGVFDLKVWNDHFILSSLNYQIKIDSTGNQVDLLKTSYVKGDSILIGKSIWNYTPYDHEASLKTSLSLNGKPIVSYTETRNANYIGKDGYFSPVSTPHNLSYFCPENHFKIFVLGEFGIEMIHDFIFPKHNIIDTALVFASRSDFLNEIITGHKTNSFDHIIRHQDYLIFRTNNMEYYAFHLVNRDFIGFSNILPDATDDFMPLMENHPVLTDGKYLYTLINPYLVREAEEIGKLEKHNMRSEYRQLRDQYNPILVRFKLKP